MTPDGVRAFLANWPWLILAIIVVWPMVHFLYGHRISALKEDLDRLRARTEEQLAETASRAHLDDSPPESSSPTAQSGAMTVQARDAEGRTRAPEEMRASGSARGLFDTRAAAEIRAAYQALPPLERKDGIRLAYGGKRIGGRGEIRRIWAGIDVIFVMLDTAKDSTFILAFDNDRRHELQALREGMLVRFEGEIESADRSSIDLVNPSIAEVAGDVAT